MRATLAVGDLLMRVNGTWLASFTRRASSIGRRDTVVVETVAVVECALCQMLNAPARR